jgi:asparagine synthase (glutamine-hydrolysing)
VERKTKIGFNTPIAEWMQGAMKEYFEDLVNSQDFNNSSLINPETVRKNILSVTEAPDKVSFGQASNAYESLVPYLWEKCFYKRASTME